MWGVWGVHVALYATAVFRVVMWYVGSGIKGVGSGIRRVGSGISAPESGIRDHKPWDHQHFLIGLHHFCGSGTKFCHAFGIKDQQFGSKNEISDEKTYLAVRPWHSPGVVVASHADVSFWASSRVLNA